MITLLLLALAPEVITFTRPGPGPVRLCDSGIINDYYSFPVTIPKVQGHVTKFEFQRIGPGQCLTLNYGLESLLPVPVDNVFEVWRDRQFWSLSPFQGSEPRYRNRLNDSSEPIGWTYTHQANLSPFDGIVDFGGTSGYSGLIQGVTSPDAWVACTNPLKLSRFEGTGNVTVYFSPRFSESISSFPSGHWGPWTTTWEENITALNIRVTFD